MCDKKDCRFVDENCDPESCLLHKMQSNNVRLLALVKALKDKRKELADLVGELITLEKKMEEENQEAGRLEKIEDLDLLMKIYKGSAEAKDVVQQIFRERLELWQDAEQIVQSLIDHSTEEGRKYLEVYEEIQTAKLKCQVHDLDIVNQEREMSGNSLADVIINLPKQ